MGVQVTPDQFLDVIGEAGIVFINDALLGFEQEGRGQADGFFLGFHGR